MTLGTGSDRTTDITLPPPPAAVHFVGIGGIGMSGLARILRAWGYRVTGSDAAVSEQTSALRHEGIPVAIGHDDTDAAASADFVVLTAAVRVDNPEVVAARDRNVPTVKRAQLLGMLANTRRCVAVAGTHGKSTTSGMVASALLTLGAEPSYAIGAIVNVAGTNAAPGRGEAMVVEADEYDYSFLWLTPDVAVITNIEFDHPDIFPVQSAYDDAFARFVAGIRAGGTLVVAADDPGCAGLVARCRPADRRTGVTFGETTEADWRLSGNEGAWMIRGPDGVRRSLPLNVPGRHNARNAAAAVAAMVALGIEAERAVASLDAYTGIGRRFEVKGEVGGVTIVDDYAHHPSEIRVILEAARRTYPGRRVWAVFQPHTFTRTKVLMDEFAGALSDADEIVLLDIYAARETDTLGISSADLLRRLPRHARLGGSPGETTKLVSSGVRAGDVVLTLGAGDITAVGPALLAELTQRHRLA
ncbi:MAG: UDP-N-acetylmuramate--L-alanine ligase [Thermomicrobiales bacterium]